MEFRNLKKQYEILKTEIDNGIKSVCENSDFISGAKVKQLEQKLSEYVCTKHCISCANGTDALSLAIRVLNIGDGDCVFLPDFTFFATAETVASNGAVPIFVDVDPDTFNICPNSLEKAIKKIIEAKTLVPKAIITVDLFGLCADYPKIKEIAVKYNLKLIEDAAQGFGARIKNKVAASFADIATTSFFPAKPLGCYGDGGAIFTDCDVWNDNIRSLAVHGKNQNDKYDNLQVGVNSRLDTIQAAVLLPKFDAFKKYELCDVNKAAQYYTDALSELVKVPMIPQDYYSSWAQYTIKLKDKNQRDLLQQHLKEKSIPTMRYYPKTMSEQTSMAQYNQYQVIDCVQAKNLTKICLSLPIGPYITRQEQDRVIKEIKAFIDNYND